MEAIIKTHDIKMIERVKRVTNKNIAVHLTMKQDMKLCNPESNISLNLELIFYARSHTWLS